MFRTRIGHCQFKKFHEDIESEYDDLIFHTEVRWLSLGQRLDRFLNLIHEIDLVMIEKNKQIPEIKNSEWTWFLDRHN